MKIYIKVEVDDYGGEFYYRSGGGWHPDPFLTIGNSEIADHVAAALEAVGHKVLIIDIGEKEGEI